MRIIYVLISLLLSPVVEAETIEFPEEELARETVLPVFDKVEVVKNRNIVLSERFELGLGVGLALNEPFYNPLRFGGSLSYHFSEIHAVNFTGQFMMDGLSGYGEQLANGEGLDGDDSLDPSLAPSPTYTFFANYQITAYYGKISLTKQSVMNLNLYGLIGLGMIGLTDGSSYGLNLGFGQKFYFTKNFALRFDLGVVTWNGPVPIDENVPLRRGTEEVSKDDLPEELQFNTNLAASLVFLI